jgi:hypothetical protein
MFPSLEITLLTNPPGIEQRQMYTTVYLAFFLSQPFFTMCKRYYFCLEMGRLKQIQRRTHKHGLPYITLSTPLTLFYTHGLEIVVLHVIQVSPCFLTYRYGNLTILEFSSKWVKVMLPYREGGGLPVMGVGAV